jgi:DNA-binding transcriptional ArsR family regulator
MNAYRSLFTSAKPLLTAFGDSRRQDIVSLLMEQSFLNVGEIAKRIGLSQPAATHHLKILHEAGVVNVKRQGTSHLYYGDSHRLQKETQPLKELITALENCPGLSPNRK